MDSLYINSYVEWCAWCTKIDIKDSKVDYFIFVPRCWGNRWRRCRSLVLVAIIPQLSLCTFLRRSMPRRLKADELGLYRRQDTIGNDPCNNGSSLSNTLAARTMMEQDRNPEDFFADWGKNVGCEGCWLAPSAQKIRKNGAHRSWYHSQKHRQQLAVIDHWYTVSTVEGTHNIALVIWWYYAAHANPLGLCFINAKHLAMHWRFAWLLRKQKSETRPLSSKPLRYAR